MPTFPAAKMDALYRKEETPFRTLEMDASQRNEQAPYLLTRNMKEEKFWNANGEIKFDVEPGI